MRSRPEDKFLSAVRKFALRARREMRKRAGSAANGAALSQLLSDYEESTERLVRTLALALPPEVLSTLLSCDKGV